MDTFERVQELDFRPDWSAQELVEIQRFLDGRHSKEEWDAFLSFFHRPRWQRRLLMWLSFLFFARYGRG